MEATKNILEDRNRLRRDWIQHQSVPIGVKALPIGTTPTHVWEMTLYLLEPI